MFYFSYIMLPQFEDPTSKLSNSWLQRHDSLLPATFAPNYKMFNDHFNLMVLSSHIYYLLYFWLLLSPSLSSAHLSESQLQ